jgi:hypothetical protein
MTDTDSLFLVNKKVLDVKNVILDVFEEDHPIKPSRVRALEKLGRALDEYLEG